MFDVLPTGYTAPTVEEIEADLEAKLLANVSATLVLSADQPLKQITGIMAEKFAELGELAAVAFNAFNRDAAENVLLDNIGDLTGTTRDSQFTSKVSCTVNLGASFSQPPGVMIANVAGLPDIKFTNLATVTSTTAGNYTNVIFQATVPGPIAANAGTLTAISTPVVGWNSITNPLDATPGALVEQDTPYRIRQRNELAASGSSTVDGLRADILAIEGVQECFVFENTTNITDGNGVPPFAIEVVIFDGTTPTASNATIFQTIWDNKPAGTPTYGSTTGTATGSDGVVRTISFSRAVVKNLYLNYSGVIIDSSFFPSDGIAQIKEAARARGVEILKLGVDVVGLQFRGAALSVAGTVDVPLLYLGFAPAPAGTANLVVNTREIAKLDTSNITVTLA